MNKRMRIDDGNYYRLIRKEDGSWEASVIRPYGKYEARFTGITRASVEEQIQEFRPHIIFSGYVTVLTRP